ncbi:MAG: hypothetical protein P4L55_21940 [Syntrophobacteraceae bacterium]|nr:hypothetical protein [Syntrophobacteraceae bacterium]
MKVIYGTVKFLILIFVAVMVVGIAADLDHLKKELATFQEKPLNGGTVAGARPTQPEVSSSLEPMKSGAPYSEASNPVNPENSKMTLEQLQEAAKQLAQSGKARDYADLLTQIENTAFALEDRQNVDDLQSKLVVRLRELVESEVQTLHGLALNAPNYFAGYSYFRDASATIALYPMSDEKEVIRRAEELSEKHRKVEIRLLTLRRQRYNFWAATQIQKALKILRNDGKEGIQPSIECLTVIEPSQMEPSVSGIYSYAVQQLMDELKKDQKAEVAKKLSDPGTERRTLEDF